LELLVLASVAVQGCGPSDPPKNGVKIQAGDYDHAPGEGKAPPNKTGKG
jgi:hypothetical protein